MFTLNCPSHFVLALADQSSGKGKVLGKCSYQLNK